MSDNPAETPVEATLEGVISIAAALRARSRPVRSILLRDDREEPPHRHLLNAARAAGVPVRRVPLAEIDAQAGGKTHGGALAFVGERVTVPLDSLAAGTASPFVVMVDGVEDPFNFGQSVRSLWAAGADGLVLRPRNWMSAAATVARASAGASELIPTAIAETAEDAAVHFAARGLTVACADGDDPRAVSLYDADLRGPLFLLVGGEKRGVSRSFARQASLVLRIPYGRTGAHALGTAAAAAVLAFEVMRQRRK